MAERNRDYLKQEFQDGERPSGADFADLIDSFLNKTHDGLAVDTDSNLILSSGLGLGDSARDVAGTLRFNGASVQFHNGTSWVNLGSGGGGAFQPSGENGAVAYAGGNVGIGNFADAPPTYRLEVNLGNNTSEAEHVRFGNVVCSNGTGAFQPYAYVSHRNHASNTAYALRQSPQGDVHINAPAGQSVSIRQNGAEVRLAVSDNGNVVVGSASDLLDDDEAVLQVNGAAFKNDGEETWSITSDMRLKEDIRVLELGLEQLIQVQPVRFRYNGKAGTPSGQERIGVIGQEIEKIFPEMVQHRPYQNQDELDGDDLLIYNGSALTYVLVNAVKELATRVERLEEALIGRNRR
ncbi:MAG: hypothetical protein ETSY2_31275 [Candidatus Entotheonella gemina]|uniref:Peptidase S74 domain-containing protein n=1 Tax=Candidatus Entotheonella gemina TaxID=1429439 RepID=W4M1I8_9BACT|nr:MAG: hypothetical protein ETSY2_31275 [Candidatus Entotheonella gemina]